MQRVLIFANGDLPDLNKVRALLRLDDFIICADGGTRHALALGLRPDLIIGDMDSIKSEVFQQLRESGVDAELFPRDKNETDLELAIDKATELDAGEMIIVAALGGRMDQALGNVSLLSAPRLSRLNVRFDDGVEEIFFCRDHVHVEGRRGDIVSLIPWGGPAYGVQTENLKWQLDGETLHPDRTRGVSNEMLSGVATVSINSGLLLVTHTRMS